MIIKVKKFFFANSNYEYWNFVIQVAKGDYYDFWSINTISITRMNSLHVNTRLGPSQHFYFGIFEEKMKVNEKIHLQCWVC